MQPRYDELARKVYMGDHSAATGNELAALGPQLAAARHQMDGYRAVNGVLIWGAVCQVGRVKLPVVSSVSCRRVSV